MNSMPQPETGASHADFLTVLECTTGRRAAKIYRDLEAKPDQYDAGYLYTPHEVPVSGLDDLAERLETLRHSPECFVIRGRLRPGAKPHSGGLYPRRCVDRPGELAPFEAAEHRYMAIDADHTDTPYDSAEPRGSVEAWRATLPLDVRAAGMVFQFSASQHLSPTIRGHAWFWLDEPLGDAPLKAWARRHGFDACVFGPVQVLYTADPIFAEGLTDPLEPRALVRLPGGTATLDLTEDERAATSSTTTRAGSVDLGEVGDPSEDERAVHARAAVAKQLSRAFSKPGARWDLCGAFGGACANAGVPPEECCAVLEALRAGDVADHDFGAGLKWALGAYGVSGRPLGHKGIREILGAITAQRVSESINTLAKLFKEATAPANDTAETEEVDLTLGRPCSFTEPEVPLDWLCKGLCLAKGGDGKISLLAGEAGGGKGPIADHLAICFALGAKAFHVHACKQVNVLLLDSEGARLTMRRLRRLARGIGRDPAELAGRLHVFGTAGENLTTEDYQARLARYAVRHKIEALILDSYTSAMLGQVADANQPDFALLAQMLGQLECLVLAVAHGNKAAAQSGRQPRVSDVAYSQALGALAQTVIVVHYPNPEDRKQIQVGCARSPEQDFAAFEVAFRDGIGQGEPLVVEVAAASEGSTTAADAKRATIEKNADRIEQHLEANLNAQGVSSVRNVLCLSGATWATAYSVCLERGSVRTNHGGRLEFVPAAQRHPSQAAEARAKATPFKWPANAGKGRK